MINTLYILRGIPGCGKSTLAETLYELHGGSSDSIICTADDYFMVDGHYRFNMKKLGEAHKWCQDRCKSGMEEGLSAVIVANTSTTEKEVKTYTNMAENYGYRIVSLIVENRHGGKNIHGVPDEVLENMHKRFTTKLR